MCLCCSLESMICKTKWQSSLVITRRWNPPTRSNEQPIQFCSRMSSQPRQSSILNWHSLSDLAGIIFTHLYGMIINSVYIVDLLCHAFVVYKF
jgi:hypothetical protein